MAERIEIISDLKGYHDSNDIKKIYKRYPINNNAGVAFDTCALALKLLGIAKSNYMADIDAQSLSI